MKITTQTLLYETEAATLRRFLVALAASVRDFGQGVTLQIGDCSAQPLLTPEAVDAWRRELAADAPLELRYTFFDDNLGFGRAHNRLRRQAPDADRLLIVNPDSLPAPHLLRRLCRIADRQLDWGAVEARQIPIEHPKPFDPVTLETEWVTGACVLVNGPAFDALGGFDELFFMYAEDVDLSWRLRAAGKRLIFCPDTFVYHAKRLVNRTPVVSEAEAYHGPLSLMLLRAKYGRDDLNARLLAMLRTDPRPECARTLADYERLLGRVRPASPAEAAIARFTPGGGLADLRWTYPLPDRLLAGV
jgi:hypothetical protein